MVSDEREGRDAHTQDGDLAQVPVRDAAPVSLVDPYSDEYLRAPQIRFGWKPSSIGEYSPRVSATEFSAPHRDRASISTRTSFDDPRVRAGRTQ